MRHIRDALLQLLAVGHITQDFIPVFRIQDVGCNVERLAFQYLAEMYLWDQVVVPRRRGETRQRCTCATSRGRTRTAASSSSSAPNSRWCGGLGFGGMGL